MLWYVSKTKIDVGPLIKRIEEVNEILIDVTDSQPLSYLFRQLRHLASN